MRIAPCSPLWPVCLNIAFASSRPTWAAASATKCRSIRATSAPSWRPSPRASTGFGRDYHIHAEIAADKDGTVKALRVHTLADHGAFDAAAQPTKFPAGLFHICTGSYDFKHAFVDVDAVHTNKAPGGIAYRCSFRVTEASYLIERMMDTLAHDLGKDPAELRLQNFIKPEAFPYRSALDWTYD